jgi:hypothetical protein
MRRTVLSTLPRFVSSCGCAGTRPRTAIGWYVPRLDAMAPPSRGVLFRHRFVTLIRVELRQARRYWPAQFAKYCDCCCSLDRVIRLLSKFRSGNCANDGLETLARWLLFATCRHETLVHHRRHRSRVRYHRPSNGIFRCRCGQPEAASGQFGRILGEIAGLAAGHREKVGRDRHAWYDTARCRTPTPQRQPRLHSPNA